MATKTEKLMEHIRSGIQEGKYQPGDQLPTHAELMEAHKVSRITVVNALKALENEGLITAAGQGRRAEIRQARRRYRWSVTYEGVKVTVPNSDPWAAQVRAQGREPSEIVKVSIEYAPEEIAADLQIPAGTRVVVRRRERSVDDWLAQLSISFFPEDVAQGTPLLDPTPVFIPGGILASVGRPQTRIVGEIDVVTPTPTQRKAFDDLAAGVQAFLVTHVGYDAQDRPLRVMQTLAPLDRNILGFEIDTSGEQVSTLPTAAPK